MKPPVHRITMHLSRLCLPLLLALCLLQPAMAGETLFQYSTIDALLAGFYDGDLTMQALKRQGDFGLGTLNGIDGELVVLDGTAYHIAAGGTASIPDDQTRVPFATVSFFTPETSLDLPAVSSLKALNAAVLKSLPSQNVFYALRIDTTFSQVEARAIPKQQPPYAPLHVVVKEQVVVPFTGPGTLVGYYSPPFVKGVNVPGFHWHFLTRDRSGGGHVLDCAFGPATAHLDALRSLTVSLPDSREFDTLDLSKDKGRELEAVEKGHPQKQ
ncbi:acetolactate decarboxylase [Pseudodesulfovibrio sediminis]|uniref:Alpha-acetolactate decarboxylase n=1 Tax=Pseudodesulfovibrio sediminis TaxID=2810563 RepID=A0ABM7P8G1_9BACT|nr:acetolactate decarboxylase [Pseudodesulfovibrio sediminis]BCS89274.1 acetolactate decarboxylase [Pseudodesulfovibrio sediminis]